VSLRRANHNTITHLVLFCDRGEVDHDAWQVDVLALADWVVGLRLALDPPRRRIHGQHSKQHIAVVDPDRLARPHLVDQLLVRDEQLRIRPLVRELPVRDEREDVALLQRHLLRTLLDSHGAVSVVLLNLQMRH
jgi:hypothetical protein